MSIETYVNKTIYTHVFLNYSAYIQRIGAILSATYQFNRDKAMTWLVRFSDSVIVGSRMPSMSDKVSLPFTEATLMECQRFANITLFNVPRCTLADTTVNGYRVPRGTWVFVNRWGVHSSTRYWNEPSKFDPTRFLDQQGQVLHNEALVPFGIGKLARLKSHLINVLASIVS